MTGGELERYAAFGAICIGFALLILYLVFKRRLALQASLLFLLLMLGLGAGFFLLHFAPEIVSILGFTLPANLLFSVGLGTLTFVHLLSLISLSRLERRSITLTQDLALLQEKVERLSRSARSGGE
ncbi:MAG: DUF2304 family protein [Myxococcales bacterium]|nr:DUF2304 family protein [Myxococcales bacterium]